MSKSKVRAVLLITAVLVLPNSTVQASSNEEALWVLLEAFLFRHQASQLYPHITFGRPHEMRQMIDRSGLQVTVNPRLRVQAKYYPGTKLLELKSYSDFTPEGLLTVFHEFVHHMVNMYGGLDCLSDEAYTAVIEARVRWLDDVIALEQSSKRGFTPESCRRVRGAWRTMYKNWNDAGSGHIRSSLDGPFTYFDENNTCKLGHGKKHQISANFINQWNVKLGIRINFAEIQNLYWRPVEACVNAARPKKPCGTLSLHCQESKATTTVSNPYFCQQYEACLRTKSRPQLVPNPACAPAKLTCQSVCAWVGRMRPPLMPFCQHQAAKKCGCDPNRR